MGCKIKTSRNEKIYFSCYINVLASVCVSSKQNNHRKSYRRKKEHLLQMLLLLLKEQIWELLLQRTAHFLFQFPQMPHQLLLPM